MSDDTETELKDLSDQLVAALSDNLVSLSLYGSLARGSFRRERSDVNLLLILQRADEETLEQLAPILAAKRRHLMVEPFILQADEIDRVSDAFPIKILDIQGCHRLLAGQEVLGELKVEKEHVRLHLEQSLRNLQLRLRRRLALHSADQLALRGHLLNLTRPLATDLRQLLSLTRGERFAEDHSRPIFAEAARSWNLDGTALELLADLRDGKEVDLSLKLLAHRLLSQLTLVIQVVDRFDPAGRPE